MGRKVLVLVEKVDVRKSRIAVILAKDIDTNKSEATIERYYSVEGSIHP